MSNHNDFFSSESLRYHGADWNNSSDEECSEEDELFIETREYDKFGNCRISYNPSSGRINYIKPGK